MPWMERDLMMIKREFISQSKNTEITFTELCKRFEISRKTGYKWLNRYSTDPVTGLDDLSTKPLTSPNETPHNIMQNIFKCREKHKTWGGRKIYSYLERKGIINLPAPSTINSILKRNGFIDADKKHPKPYIRFEHANPNDLWQMDFKGHFEYEDGRCHPLTIIDDCSRFSIIVAACSNETSKTVKTHLISIFKKYGLPKRINVDNGSPWGVGSHDGRYTRLSIWLIEQGIQVSYSRPMHPQTNGKIERFHRTLKQEILSVEYYKNLDEIQSSVDKWRDEYNHERPHEAIDNKVPADLYIPSYRTYEDASSIYAYPEDYQPHRVDNRGRVALKGKIIYVGTPFIGKTLGLRYEANSSFMQIYYHHQKIGRVDLDSINKGTTINLCSGKVLEA